MNGVLGESIMATKTSTKSVSKTQPIEVRAAANAKKVMHTAVAVGGATVIGAAIGISSGMHAAVEANGGHVPKWLSGIL